MKKVIRNIGAAALVATSFSAIAATQGTVGSVDSKGTTVITLTVGNQIVVSNIKDINLTTTSAVPGTDITGSETLCVGAIGFSGYSVELDSGNGGQDTNVYQLSNGTDTITYQVAFDDDESSTAGSSPTVNGSIPTGFSNVSTLGCSADNAKIFVTVPTGQWESITDATNLTDTLTITVSGS